MTLLRVVVEMESTEALRPTTIRIAPEGTASEAPAVLAPPGVPARPGSPWDLLDRQPPPPAMPPSVEARERAVALVREWALTAPAARVAWLQHNFIQPVNVAALVGAGGIRAAFAEALAAYPWKIRGEALDEAAVAERLDRTFKDPAFPDKAIDAGVLAEAMEAFAIAGDVLPPALRRPGEAA